MARQPNPERLAAKQAGRGNYVSLMACDACGTHVRYVANNACAECSKAKVRKAANTAHGRLLNRERQERFLARKQSVINALLDDI